jgi:hypothetical protein
MGDLTREIEELLDEGSSPEAKDETGRDETSAGTAESGEGGGEAQAEGTSQETETAGGQEESQTQDSEEGDGSQTESQESERGVESSESESQESEGSEEEDPRDAQIRKLQEEVNRLAKGEGQTQSQDQSQQEQDQGSQESQAEPFDPMMGYDHDSLMESSDTFKEWASKLYEQAKKDAHEEVLQKLPETVNSYVQTQVTIQDQAREFYRNNPELSEHKDYVSRVANEVAAEHPDWTFSDVLDETANRARQTLGLKQQAQQSERETSGQRKTPAFASGTQGNNSKKSSGGKETLSEVEKQIQDVISEDY